MKKFPRRNWTFPVLIVSVFLNIMLLIRGNHASDGVLVVGVIDGDTVVLEGKSLVRLRYVDAPEKELCGYDEAANVLEKLVVGKKIRIEEIIPDEYGRGMALIYVGNTLINKDLLSTGWVRYHHDISSKTEEIKKAADIARDAGRGVYGLCQSKDTPVKPGCVIKGNIDKNSDRRNYYLPGCVQYKYTVVEKDIGENWFCTEKEAVSAGYTRAKTCR